MRIKEYNIHGNCHSTYRLTKINKQSSGKHNRIPPFNIHNTKDKTQDQSTYKEIWKYDLKEVAQLTQTNPKMTEMSEFEDTDFTFFFKILFIHKRHTERGRDVGIERSRLHAGSLTWGLNPKSPGSGPGLKAALNRWATGDAYQIILFLLFVILSSLLSFQFPCFILSFLF